MSSRTLTIDPQLKSLFPPLTDEQRAGLEQRIKTDGCLSPIVVWKSKNVIVDGHNRYEICKKNNVAFEVEEIDFKNVGEVLEWMWQVQSFRRNWTPEQAKLALGFVYNEQKQEVGRPAEEEKKPATKAAAKPDAKKPVDKKATDKKPAAQEPAKPEPVPQAEATAERLAKEHNVSPRQVQIAGKFAQEIAAIEEKCGVDAKNAIVMRSIKSSADTVAFLAAMPKHDAQKVATQIKRGEAASLKEAIVAAGFKLPKKAKKKPAQKQEKEKVLTPPAAFKTLDALIGQIARAIDMTATATGGQTVRSRECHAKLGTLATAITEWKRTVKK